MLTTEDILKQQMQATALIKSGMRISLVHAMTKVSNRTLRDIWQDTYGSGTPAPGRLPNNALSYIKQGQSPIGLSTIVAAYLAIEKDQSLTLSEAFLQSWDMAALFAPSDFDINAAWYAIRDVKAGLISWVECQTCKAHHFYDTEIRKTSKCPYCGEQHYKLIEVAA